MANSSSEHPGEVSAMNASGATLLRYSTDKLPERDRVPFWCDEFARAALQLTVAPIAEKPFRQVGMHCSFDHLAVTFGETNGFRSWRDKTQVANSNDDLILSFGESGYHQASQIGRELEIARGEAVVVTCGEVLAYHITAPTRGYTVRIPRRVLAELVADPEGAVMRRIPANSSALQLLTGYVALLSKEPLSSPKMQRAFATHIYDLAALTLGAKRDAAAAARSRGLRAARLAAVLRAIENLSVDPGLSAAGVGEMFGITPRYVHLVLEETGKSFTHHVLERRLEKVLAMLRDPRRHTRRITDIAHEAGFTDLSYFGRAFRRRYGMTPSDVRETARRDCGRNN
jgi:AraC-like DNA-binding protein